jgi:hypothetical protein
LVVAVVAMDQDFLVVILDQLKAVVVVVQEVMSQVNPAQVMHVDVQILVNRHKDVQKIGDIYQELWDLEMMVV